MSSGHQKNTAVFPSKPGRPKNKGKGMGAGFEMKSQRGRMSLSEGFNDQATKDN